MVPALVVIGMEWVVNYHNNYFYFISLRGVYFNFKGYYVEMEEMPSWEKAAMIFSLFFILLAVLLFYVDLAWLKYNKANNSEAGYQPVLQSDDADLGRSLEIEGAEGVINSYHSQII
jgi:hypothetical protein